MTKKAIEKRKNWNWPLNFSINAEVFFSLFPIKNQIKIIKIIQIPFSRLSASSPNVIAPNIQHAIDSTFENR